MAKFTGSLPVESPSTRAFGTRVRVDVGTTFPDEAVVGVAPFRDTEGRPLYVGTAVLDDSAIPCQVSEDLATCLVRPHRSLLITSHIQIDPQTLQFKRPMTRKSRQAQPARRVSCGSLTGFIHLCNGYQPHSVRYLTGNIQYMGGALVTYGGEEYFFDSDYYVFNEFQMLALKLICLVTVLFHNQATKSEIESGSSSTTALHTLKTPPTDNKMADTKTAPQNPMKELRIDKLVISELLGISPVPCCLSMR
ncbi:hypothetical protein AG1IA_02340 [Rhizoctonia solani AG-1 IA]|uniref:Uncharacterized protein n=1 Tax=Thanatephorus cucumeris (strain AG1-IA) TaxID=983506 RepID=L8X4U5_THACA|nr:hypothetical protein AG1IA_02340 [Rhizoctonia solani AG-1 IA]